VFGADHVYRMDPSQMVGQHVTTGAGVTVAGIRVPRSTASAFGCIDADATGQINRFLEKPLDPPAVPDDPEVTFASMGNYVFSADILLDALAADARSSDSDHDMGGDIIPMLVGRGEAAVYDFADNVVPGATDRDRGYWRDVGTLDAYYDAHMDLVSVHPIFNLYNRLWPIRTETAPLPPAKFVQGGAAQDSIVSLGSIISGATVTNSVISSDVQIEAGTEVHGSVLLPGVRIGKGAVVRRAILDKNVIVPDGAQLGVDLDEDRRRYTVSAEGVVVLGKGARAE
jgi:glucose-1-phosphate adenylyltransferase